MGILIDLDIHSVRKKFMHYFNSTLHHNQDEYNNCPWWYILLYPNYTSIEFECSKIPCNILAVGFILQTLQKDKSGITEKFAECVYMWEARQKQTDE